jgi:hypothetical protein
MFSTNRVWHKVVGASSTALHTIRQVAGVALPDAYIDLLRFSNGGEGPLPIAPYNFCLDSAEDATKLKVDRTYDEYFPGFFVFGCSGGGEYIAFDLRGTSPWPVVAIDMTNIDLSESVQVLAQDFSIFMEFVGVEKPDA